jgi:hypothetical protein
MNTIPRELLLQRWHVVQHELLPGLRREITLTPKLERVIHTLEVARVEAFSLSRYAGTGRPPRRCALRNDDDGEVAPKKPEIGNSVPELPFPQRRFSRYLCPGSGSKRAAMSASLNFTSLF